MDDKRLGDRDWSLGRESSMSGTLAIDSQQTKTRTVGSLFRKKIHGNKGKGIIIDNFLYKLFENNAMEDNIATKKKKSLA